MLWTNNYKTKSGLLLSTVNINEIIHFKVNFHWRLTLLTHKSARASNLLKFVLCNSNGTIFMSVQILDALASNKISFGACAVKF